MSKQKISFRVPPGLWSSFAEQADSLFLNRAPFLNQMIAFEVSELAADLAGRRLSLRAKRHISGMLKREGAKPVNIEIDESTAAALNAVVRETNIVRDAFLCRLIIFLRSSNALLKFLDIPREVGRGQNSSGLEGMPTSPLKAMEAVRDDPLFYIRHHVQTNDGGGIYSVGLPRSMDWACCFLDDKDVVGTKAHKEEQRRMAELFDLLEGDEFTKASQPKKEGSK